MSKTHFDAIIVGSGFGGSVMAYRLAEAGLKVCLLERGKAYPPGSFPRSPHKMKSNFWDPSEGLHGMFNVWSFRGIDALVSSGLGGGSLIYANVLLRKDEKWFVKEDLQKGGYEYWPVTREDLDPHYKTVEAILAPQKYPIEHEPYRSTPKTIALRNAAERLGLEWDRPNLAVTFANSGRPPVPGEPIEELRPNLHRLTRSTCRLCGECNIGCNYGSKNSLDYNYLTRAQRLGALLKTQCEVRSFAPRPGGGYIVRYVEHLPENEHRPTDTSALPLKILTCDRLILSAGTLGSTFLLLNNRAAFPGLSERLGSRFSGNGDFLTVAFKGHQRSNGRRLPLVVDPSFGPVITSYLRVPDALDGGPGGRGFYIQDAGYPEFINWMVQTAEAPGAIGRFARFVGQWLLRLGGCAPQTNIGSDIAALLGDAATGNSSLPMLGMGRDIPNGNMSLREGFLDVDWRMDKSSDFFKRVRDTMQDVAESLDATLIDDPLSYLRKVITVHPLGGCPMGRDPVEGVVDAHGEVFNYKGLYVSDGAVMPGPVGANPSLTIAALADRFADRIIDGVKVPRSRSRQQHTNDSAWIAPPPESVDRWVDSAP
jgi:cholesterol oxidase